MAETVVNLSGHPISLEGGVILARNGSEGDRQQAELTEGDRRRLLERGQIAVIPATAGPVGASPIGASPKKGKESEPAS